MDSISAPRQTFVQKAARHAPAIWCASIALVIIVVLVFLLAMRPAPSIPIPSQVSAPNCLVVAKASKVSGTKLTVDGLGKYYAGWVRALSTKQANGKLGFTHQTLYEAGIAVTACLR